MRRAASKIARKAGAPYDYIVGEFVGVTLRKR
jgi:hypothetical protein